jgi:hypothetical protein
VLKFRIWKHTNTERNTKTLTTVGTQFNNNNSRTETYICKKEPIISQA